MAHFTYNNHIMKISMGQLLLFTFNPHDKTYKVLLLFYFIFNNTSPYSFYLDGVEGISTKSKS